MNTWLIILLGLLVLLYGVARMSKPAPIRLSRFEVERRAREGDAKAQVWREQLRVLPVFRALRRFVSLILIVWMTVVLTSLVGTSAAFLAAIVIALAIDWLVRWGPLRRLGERLFDVRLSALGRLPGWRPYLFFLPIPKPAPPQRINSEPELLHLLDSSTFLEPERRALIHSALEFTGLSVSDAMSGRRSIHAVDKADVLGPLVLDQLHKTGKQAFVVIDGNLDDVIGILKLERLTSLDLKDSPAALKAMSPEVHFIDTDAPITDALAYLRSSKAPFLVVQDADGATAGLLSMDNILRCLFEAA